MNTQIENVLSRCQGVKKTGPERYIAKCPAHNDKSPSLAITVTDEKILLHCFGGCATNDVLASVGLDLKDLFPERIRPENGKRAKFNAYDILKCLKDEITIILIASADCMNKKPISEADFKRVQIAHTNIQDAVSLVWGRP